MVRIEIPKINYPCCQARCQSSAPNLEHHIAPFGYDINPKCDRVWCIIEYNVGIERANRYNNCHRVRQVSPDPRSHRGDCKLFGSENISLNFNNDFRSSEQVWLIFCPLKFPV